MTDFIKAIHSWHIILYTVNADHLPERIANAVWMMAPGGTGLVTIGEI
jgi:hypothetical protein